MNPTIQIRKATLKDQQDFINSVLFTAPEFFLYLFGPNVKNILAKLFEVPFNLFSYTNCWTIEYEGKVAGMMLAYPYRGWRTVREGLRTGFLLAKYMGVIPLLRRFGTIFKLNPADLANLWRALIQKNYYISNIANYPQFRGLGLGKKLLLKAEEEARIWGIKKCALDVETENEGAIAVYKKLGWEIEWKLKSINVLGKNFSFFRMSKNV